MILHDVSDIFLHAAKIALFYNNLFYARSFFVGLILVWIAGRLFYYPLVMWTVYSSRPRDIWIVDALYLLPALLYVLDWIWFVDIVKVAWSGAKEDVTEKKE